MTASRYKKGGVEDHIEQQIFLEAPQIARLPFVCQDPSGRQRLQGPELVQQNGVLLAPRMLTAF